MQWPMATAHSWPWVVIVNQYGTILTSADGITWTLRTSGTNDNLNGVTYGNGTFVAVGGSSYNPWGHSEILTSSDGIIWTSRTSGAYIVISTGVTYGNGTFVAVGYFGSILTSADGITWTIRTSGASTYSLLEWPMATAHL